MKGPGTAAFERAASEEKGSSLAAELWAYLRENKRWWLLPLLLIILVQAVLVLLSSSAAAPFLYPLF